MLIILVKNSGGFDVYFSGSQKNNSREKFLKNFYKKITGPGKNFPELSGNNFTDLFCIFKNNSGSEKSPETI
jgi:hypothetical protein